MCNPPPGIRLPPGTVLRLRLLKTLYGMKQAPYAWNNEFNRAIVEVIHYTRCQSDTCLYVKKSRTGRVVSSISQYSSMM